MKFKMLLHKIYTYPREYGHTITVDQSNKETELVLTLKGILVQYIVHHLHTTSLNIVLVLALLRKTMPIVYR